MKRLITASLAFFLSLSLALPASAQTAVDFYNFTNIIDSDNYGYAASADDGISLRELFFGFDEPSLEDEYKQSAETLKESIEEIQETDDCCTITFTIESY